MLMHFVLARRALNEVIPTPEAKVSTGTVTAAVRMPVEWVKRVRSAWTPMKIISTFASLNHCCSQGKYEFECRLTSCDPTSSVERV